jgi:hypothetical protein
MIKKQTLVQIGLQWMKNLSIIIYYFSIKFAKSIDFTDLQWRFTVKGR